MTRLVLLAHAETDATRRSAFPDGEGLNHKGLRAARDHSTSMPERKAALTSPAPAARETASVTRLEAGIDDGLRDLDVGRWRGRSLAEIGASAPEEATDWISNPTFAGHGGESITALIARVDTWLTTRREASGTTIAVTHAAVLRGAIVAILRAPASAFWLVDVGPLTMITLTSDGRRWALRDLRTP